VALQFLDAVEQFCAWLLAARGRSRNTVEAYRRDLRQFAELSCDEPEALQVSALSREHVLRWTLQLGRAELAGRSRSRKLSALRAFVGWALEYGHLAADPVPAELRSAPALNLPHALTEAEVNALLAAAGAGVAAELLSADQQRDLALFETLYATGMRVSEICGLRLDALQLGEGFAIVTGKGSKQRLVPLGQPAIEALQRWLAGPRAQLCPSSRRHDEVFLTRRGPISRSQVFRLIKGYAAAAGITRNVSPHTLRHSCASHMLAHGADLRLVQELLGHSALSTTQVYTHIEKSRLRKVYDQAHPLA
jgi:integrase/recombinase XerD